MKTFIIKLSHKEFEISQDDDGKFIFPEKLKVFESQGTALKPAHEPILLARKPISEKNIASNVLKWRTGGLNIGDCRINHNENLSIERNEEKKLDTNGQGWGFKAVSRGNKGRFPANLILGCCCEDDELIEGEAGGSQGHWSRTKTSGFGEFGGGKSEYNGVGEKDNMKCLIHANLNCVCVKY